MLLITTTPLTPQGVVLIVLNWRQCISVVRSSDFWSQNIGLLSWCSYFLTPWPGTTRPGARLSYPIHSAGILMSVPSFRGCAGTAWGNTDVKSAWRAGLLPNSIGALRDAHSASARPLLGIPAFHSPLFMFLSSPGEIMAPSPPLPEHSDFTLTSFWVWLDQVAETSVSPSVWSSQGAGFSLCRFKYPCSVPCHSTNAH